MTDEWTRAARQRIEKLIASLASAGSVNSSDPADAFDGLDSLGIVELVVALEREFSVSLPADLISVETFSSVDGVVEAVRASVGSAAGTAAPAAAPAAHSLPDGAGTAARSPAETGTGIAVGVHDHVVDGRLVPPPDGTIVDVLTSRASTDPEAPFLTWLPAAGEPESLTFGELDARSRSLAAALSAGGGLTGRRVGLLAANDIPTVVAMFALLRAGATCLFLNPLDPPRRLRSILADHSVSTVFRPPGAGAGAGGDLARPLPEHDDVRAGDAWSDAPLPAGRPAFMFGTSGSTAASKLVQQSHRSLLSNAEALRRHHGLGTDTTIMGGLPLHHVNGVHFTVVAVLHAGAHVVLPQEFSALRYRDRLDEHRPHIASVVPTVLETLVATGRGWRPPNSLRYFVTAAAPMTASLARRVVTTFGVRVVQGYGLTETTNFSTTLPVDLSDDDYAGLILDAPIPTVGVALHGNDVAVLSRSGEPVAEGEIGEVCMRGHNVMDGYADRPDLTAEAFSGGWFHSGDLGYWTAGPDGRRYYHLTGRIKNVAKVRGEAVSLEEVERALCSLDGVADAGCVAVPHPFLGEEIVAAVTLRGAEAGDLPQRLSSLVPAAALPRRWHDVPRIPRTPTGKLRRAELRDILGLEE